MTTKEGSKVTKVCLGWPWYDGPDVDTYTAYMCMCHYFGRMQERSYWLQHYDAPDIPLLDKIQTDGDKAEITKDDGVFEFYYADEAGLSLPGLARERVVDKALELDCDYVFFWDDDMHLAWSAFLKLWRHQKPLVAALAFTARHPVQPVIYRIKQEWDTPDEMGRPTLLYKSQFVFDYPKNKLITDTDVGGPIAFGAGVMLAHTNVFRQVPKPWFHSTGCGEDWMFCVRCYQNGVPRYVDTSVKTLHKVKEPRWNSEESYEQCRKDFPLDYKRLEEEQ